MLTLPLLLLNPFIFDKLLRLYHIFFAMASQLQTASIVESELAEKPEEDVLNVYQDVFKGEAHSLGQFSSGTLNSMLTFVRAPYFVTFWSLTEPNRPDSSPL